MPEKLKYPPHNSSLPCNQDSLTSAQNHTGLSAPFAKIIETLQADLLEKGTLDEKPFIKKLRDSVKAGRVLLKNLDLLTFDIEKTIFDWALFVDQIMLLAWSRLEWSDSALANNHDGRPSLIAVGGYGRGELHPYSDVDILILLSEKASPEVQATIEKFLALVWDIKLTVGHSVRTVEECVEVARRDITIATNLVETRLIIGSENLWSRLQSATGPEHIWPTDAFFEAKKAEQESRHKKYGNTEYNLEPDIKNAPGALRDIQTIGWIIKRHNQRQIKSQPSSATLFTREELTLLEQSKRFLWKVRFALHILTGREENRLLFNYQKELAIRLGYKASNAKLAVENFMKQYYCVAMEVAELNDLILQLFTENILQYGQVTSITPINARFQICNNYIEVTDANLFANTPSALLEIFVILAQSPSITAIRASTMRLIRSHSHLIDEQFRKDENNSKLFIELLRSPHRLFTQLKRMKRSGILGRYIPAFQEIVGQMQFDLFHIYTVDAHTLVTIRNMRNFRQPEVKAEFPITYEIINQLPKIELLYIAGFFHDLGKGRGGDHSEIGSSLVEQFCHAHHLPRWDTRLVSWLVTHHLLMSLTAQKKDISDPEVIHTFALEVGDQITLDYLFVLTVADIRATNPNLWNSWRAALLKQLYLETKRALRRGLENPIDKEQWIDETKQSALTLLANHGISTQAVEPIWSQLPDDYFIKESAEDITWHTLAILNPPHDTSNAKDSQMAKRQPIILIKANGSNVHKGATQIFVYTEDRPNLFAKTVIALDSLGLSIHDAQIMTSNTNFSLDTYIVLDRNNKPIDLNDQVINEIRASLIDSIQQDSIKDPRRKQLIPRRLKSFTVTPEVLISSQPDGSYTIIEIRTIDRPGILAIVGRVFHRFNIFVNSAKITTLGERAEDIFFVTDASHNGITDPEVCKSLQTALYEELEKLS